jgi:NTE family protein
VTILPFPARDPRAAPRPREEVALVLSGGNALGAYQAGAIERLLAAGHRPARLAGTSIGAVHAAIVAGNAPEDVPERLRRFWDRLSQPESPWSRLGLWGRWAGLAGAQLARLTGRPGLSRRGLPGLFGPPDAIGLFDLDPLARTLGEIVDFGRLNGGPARVTVVATDLSTGEAVRFDTAEEALGPLHVLASCAFPPDYRPVEIDGRHLGDGGLVDNAPVDVVLDDPPAGDLLCFVVDLFDRRGSAPTDLGETLLRLQDLVFAGQSRLGLDLARERLRLRRVLRALGGRLPPELRDDPDLAPLLAGETGGDVTLLRLSRGTSGADTALRMWDYGAQALAARWRAGAADMEEALGIARARRRGAGLVVHEVGRAPGAGAAPVGT